MVSSDPLSPVHSPQASPRFTTPAVAVALLACLAVVTPTLIAYNVSPSATFFNQAAAFVGWGFFLAVVALDLPAGALPRSRGAWALIASLLLLIALSVAASLWRHVPWSLTLSSVLTLAAALLTVGVGASLARAGLAEPAFRAFCIALVVAGVLSSVIGVVQVAWPEWPDSEWVAASAIPGRATGNVRQPNHLSSLLLWSLAAVLWLGDRWPRWRWAAWALAVLFIEVIVLSASRTGLLGMLVLIAWGVADRRLSRGTRLFLCASVFLYLALWGLTDVWSHLTGMAFGGGERLSGKGLYVSYSRYKIWDNSLSMIAQHPWLGVGFGEFNFAWSLTPFPERPVAFFDHAHNIALQFAVELGVPLAALVLGLMAWALVAALVNAEAEGSEPGVRPSRLLEPDLGGPALPPGPQRAALAMVVMAGVHSLLEYPLWYAYFLLPVAFAFGLALERPLPALAGRRRPADPSGELPAALPCAAAAAAMIIAAGLSLWDYARVAVIFSPPAEAPPLEQRIATGRHSVLFAHHADYAFGTVDDHPGQAIAGFKRAPHYLLDTRLMMAWAKALEETGEDDKARYMAARLKEFHNADSEEFFAPCAAAAAPAGEAAAASAPALLPFQCLAPKRAWRYEDFR